MKETTNLPEFKKLLETYWNDGHLPAYAWPGGYQLLYYSEGYPTCPACANQLMAEYVEEVRNQFFQWATSEEYDSYPVYETVDIPDACEVHWEGEAIHCEDGRSKDCIGDIESAYGPVE